MDEPAPLCSFTVQKKKQPDKLTQGELYLLAENMANNVLKYMPSVCLCRDEFYTGSLPCNDPRCSGCHILCRTLRQQASKFLTAEIITEEA